MRSLSSFIKLSAGLALISLPGIAIPAPPGGVFRPDVPFGLEDLPPGLTRAKIETLPLPAQERAMAWLNSFSFHESDLPFIKVDNEGGVFYTDASFPGATPEATETSSGEGDTPPLEAVADVFKLHSKAGASKVYFLDFDGHVISNTAWNYGAEPSYSATPFDTDGNFSSFSAAERIDIHEIWHRVAEDFAPFDIDVTTEAPATFTPTTGRLLITRNSDLNGKPMPHSGSGGVAYVGPWGYSNFSYYSPALVYYNNLASHAPIISEAASHEAGHNLNLAHDGQGTSTYYAGHGSGYSYTSWAPVMGVGYDRNVTQWSKGEYSGATQTQDDLAIISSRLGYRSDDHSASTSAATELIIAADGSIGVSNPQTDPANTIPSNKGIITNRYDIDTFSFDAGEGNIDIAAIPAWDAFYRDIRRGANLDIALTLLDDSGVIATSDPSDNTDARIVQSLPAGRYYLKVRGVGNSSSPYSDYGSLGQYFITGNVVPSDTTAPTPNPMRWALYPGTPTRDSMNMTALAASDESGVVEYQFICIAGGSGCTNSAWQTDTSYVATGLSPSTGYTYQVIARDLYNNITTASASATGYTAENLMPTANADTASGDENSVITINALVNDTDPEGDSLVISSFTDADNGSISTDGNTLTYTPNAGFSGNDSFIYFINDGMGGEGGARIDITVNSLNDAPNAANDSASVNDNSSITINALENDSDPDGDSLSISSVGSASNGSTSTNGSTITYTPNVNFSGSDSFSYTISDGAGGNATALVSISVNRVNDAPIAVNDSASGNEDNSITIDALSNDTDPDGDSLIISSVGPASHGYVSTNGSTITYIPLANFSGSDSFLYYINDGGGLYANAIVSITVNPVNDVPKAVNDNVSLNENSAIVISALTNDSDPDGDSLSISSVTSASNGSTSTNGSTITYTPNVDFSGNDSFSYTINDGAGGDATALVSISVNRVNDAPIAVNDSASGNEDSAITIDVLSNDSDPDGDSLSIYDVRSASHGLAYRNGSTVTYIPSLNFNGSDSFSYTIIDDSGAKATATVSLTINPVNDRPSAVNDSASGNEDSNITINNALDNDSDLDGDSLIISSVGAPSHGYTSVNGSTITYRPLANFSGSDSFLYYIKDGGGLYTNAMVSITVNPVNDTPKAVNDNASVNENSSIAISALTNDSDPDGDSLSISSVGSASNGSTSTNGSTITYTPHTGFSGSDGFSYTISDGAGGGATAMVSISVNPVNDAPTAVNDYVSGNEDSTITINALSNDSDPDGDSLSISSVGSASSGSTSTNGSSITYTPNVDFSGSDSFNYSISDGVGGRATATINVTVNPVNDAPTAVNDSASVATRDSVTIDVLANDSDKEGSPLTLISVGSASKGSVSINGSSVIYTAGKKRGNDTISYTVSDGDKQSTASISITIGGSGGGSTGGDDGAKCHPKRGC